MVLKDTFDETVKEIESFNLPQFETQYLTLRAHNGVVHTKCTVKENGSITLGELVSNPREHLCPKCYTRTLNFGELNIALADENDLDHYNQEDYPYSLEMTLIELEILVKARDFLKVPQPFNETMLMLRSVQESYSSIEDLFNHTSGEIDSAAYVAGYYELLFGGTVNTMDKVIAIFVDLIAKNHSDAFFDHLYTKKRTFEERNGEVSNLLKRFEDAGFKEEAEQVSKQLLELTRQSEEVELNNERFILTEVPEGIHESRYSRQRDPLLGLIFKVIVGEKSQFWQLPLTALTFLTEGGYITPHSYLTVKEKLTPEEMLTVLSLKDHSLFGGESLKEAYKSTIALR